MFAFSQVIIRTLCLETDLASRTKSSKTCHESSEPVTYLIFVLKNTWDLKRVLTPRIICERYLIGFIKFFAAATRCLAFPATRIPDFNLTFTMFVTSPTHILELYSDLLLCQTYVPHEWRIGINLKNHLDSP